MPDLSLPSVKCVESAGSHGRFVADSLESGIGITLGNALRRMLLSSLPGAAITWVKIEGIQHEFSPIPNAKEDVVEFLLNVKEIRLRPLSHEPGKLTLEVKGEGNICAADIQPSSAFQIVNPELYLATLTSPEAHLHVEFNAELGRGYMCAKSSDGLPIEAIPVDAIFNPVRKVNYSIETIRTGEERNPERLILDVWTDGTITPEEAVSQGATILNNQLSPFRNFEVTRVQEAGLGTLSIPSNQYNTPLEGLGLSTRAYNSLRRGGITTLGQLLERGRESLPSLPGLGAKSRKEVEDLILKLSFPITAEEGTG